MNSKKYFYFNTFSQYLTLIFNIVVGVYLLPFYLKYIGIESYGIWVSSLAFISIFLLIDPGFTFVMPQRIAQLNKLVQKQSISKFLTESFLIAIFLSCGIFCLVVVLVYSFSFYWQDSQTIAFVMKHLIFIFIYILTQFFVVVFNSLSIGLKVTWFNGIVSHISNILGIFLTIIFLRYGYGVSSFIYTLIIKNLFFITCNIFYFKRIISFDFVGLNFNVYRENAKAQIFATLFSELPKSLPSIIVGTYSPSLVSSLKITQSIPELARGILEKPVYVAMPIITERKNEVRENNSIQAHLFLTILYLFFCFLAFFILQNELILQLWIGNLKGIDISFNLPLISYVSVSLVSKILTYTMYSMGEAKVINQWITNSSIIGVIGSLFLFNYNFIVIFYFILSVVEMFIVYKVLLHLNFLKIFNKCTFAKIFSSILLIILSILVCRAGYCINYLGNILVFVIVFALLSVIFKNDLFQTRLFLLSKK